LLGVELSFILRIAASKILAASLSVIQQLATKSYDRIDVDFMMYHQRTGARAEHRQHEGLRIKESASLADTFRQLKSLTVDLAYYGPEGKTRTGEIKYTVNLANAKSVFCFNCPNGECVRGDFDLSEDLARAVTSGLGTVTGEMSCPGWRSKTTIETTRCGNLLRYKLSLAY
jgi:hypothetical protein